jgi:AAA domain
VERLSVFSLSGRAAPVRRTSAQGPPPSAGHPAADAAQPSRPTEEGASSPAAGRAAAAPTAPLQPPPHATYIRELAISNFALVAEERVALAPGLNVITGESGSGKSVLVEAFAQILGAPAADGCVRPPASAAVVEGRVHVAPSAKAVGPPLNPRPRARGTNTLVAPGVAVFLIF